MAYPHAVYLTTSDTDTNFRPQDGVVVSSTETYYSKMWTGAHSDGYSASVFFVGTMTGSFTLWTTNKPEPNEANDDDWTEDTDFDPTDPAGASGKFQDDAANSKAYYKRLKYINDSGTGTIFAYISVPGSI